MRLGSLQPLWLDCSPFPCGNATGCSARSWAWDCSYPGRISSPWWWHHSPLSASKEDSERQMQAVISNFFFYLVNRIYTESKIQERDNPPSPFTSISQFSVKIRWHRDKSPVSLFLHLWGRVCPQKTQINPLVHQNHSTNGLCLCILQIWWQDHQEQGDNSQCQGPC